MDDGLPGFSAVYERYGRSVHAFLARLLGDPGTADEICQETFVRYLEHEDALAGRNGHVAPWLFRVAMNLGLDRLKRKTSSPLEHEDRLPGPALAVPNLDEKERVRNAVEALAPDLRAAFLLRAHHALSFPQIAVVLDVSERAAKERYRRARDRLVERLTPFFPEYAADSFEERLP